MTESSATTMHADLAEQIDKANIVKWLSDLKGISDQKFGQGVTRLCYSQDDLKGKNYVAQLMIDSGLNVEVSPIGNTFGRLTGPGCDEKIVMTGSHTDSVINGGSFDGIVGVVCAIEALRVLGQVKDKLKHPIEVVDWTGEEASRFGLSMIGSKAFMGDINPDSMQLHDNDGISLAQAIHGVEGLAQYKGEKTSHWTEQSALLALKGSRGDVQKIHSYVELHVEQAGFLEESAIPIGIVSGAAMPTRWSFEVVGEQAHSGTTPMERRKNALVAASEFVILVDQLCKSEAHYGTVGAVTRLTVEPNVMNTVPGNCSFFLDLRSTDKESKDRVKGLLLEKMTDICDRHGVSYSYKVISEDDPKTFSADIMTISKRACDSLDTSYMELPSRAGHDACTMSNHLKEVGMIFVPSKGGVSHHLDEWSDIEDIVLGTKVLLLTLFELSTRK